MQYLKLSQSYSNSLTIMTALQAVAAIQAVTLNNASDYQPNGLLSDYIG